MTRLYSRGITLVELLITMAIMAIIAAAIMGTASAAMESARRSRTLTLVQKIDRLIAEQFASYQTRRIDVSPVLISELDQYVNAPNLSAQQRADRMKQRGLLLAELRLMGVRELMKYEMPDRWTDFAVNSTNPVRPTIVLSAPPALAQTYARRFLQSKNHQNLGMNKGAECLYLTVMYATGDGEARTQFSAQDIGDTDGDGALEFIDGWGRPITWLRWAPGFVSSQQPRDPATGLPPADAPHDPLDVYKRDAATAKHVDPATVGLPSAVSQQLDLINDRNANGLSAFRLTPLIYSPGRDAEWGINSKDGDYVAGLDPYYVGEGANSTQPGTIEDRSQVIDNIHNHLTEY